MNHLASQTNPNRSHSVVPVWIALLFAGLSAAALWALVNASLPASQAAVLWAGRLAAAAGLALALALLLGRLFTRSAAQADLLADAGASLAGEDTPALARSLGALNLGDLTQRLQVVTQALPDDDGPAGAYNQILANLKDCAHSYNWITTPPCRRLFYVGTDSFQEGQTAGKVMGELLGEGQVLVAGHLVQDNLKLRRDGFLTTLRQSFPRMQVVHVVNTSDLDDGQVQETYRDCLRQYPRLAGFYATDQETLMLMVDVLSAQAAPSGRIKILSHDLSDRTARHIQDGTITATIDQNPMAQGYDPVIYLYNHLVSGWQPSSGRLLLQPAMVTRDNLDQFWQMGRGPVQVASGADRPRPVDQRPNHPLKIAMVSLDFDFFNTVREGALAAARLLQPCGVQVDWL
ncbi:MAG: sugar ABC transporter substrate-binding protein, partial [Chloroflexi bacterium]|nr:sugar ABC transporter substrate-binding protein [Chloroflexota bacterium]